MPTYSTRLAMMLAIALIVWHTAPAAGASVDALVRRARTELRAAENTMFSGNTEAAQMHLNSTAGLILQIEATDPSHRELPRLKERLTQTQNNLNRRTGQSGVIARPLETEEAEEVELQEVITRTPSEVSPPTPPSVSEVRLPYRVRETLRAIDQLTRSIEYRFDKMEEAKEGETTTAPERYAQQIEEMCEQVQELLDKAKAEAEAEGIAEHADLATIEEQLAAYPQRLATVSASVAEAQHARRTAASEIAGDIETLQTAYQRLRAAVFNKASGSAIYYNDLAAPRELLSKIEAFEKDEKEEAQRLLDEFRAKYGTTEEEIRAATSDMAAVRAARNMAEGIENVAKTRRAMADDMATKITQRLAGLERAHDFSRRERHDELREWLVVAQAYDPDAQGVKELTESLEQQLAQDAEKMQKKIASRTWPEHAANAPENAGELSQNAYEWFVNDPGWGRNPTHQYTVLAVAITGPWSIQARNLLGEPTMYGLPVRLAVQRPDDKAQGLARVFILTLRTREERGVEMAPPFSSVTVGDSYLMPATHVPTSR